MFADVDGATLANWFGYAGCAYGVLCILFQLRAWRLTVRLYGRFPLRASLRMLACRAKSKYAFHLFLPLLAAGVMVVIDDATGVEHSPGILAALVLFQVYLWLYQATPPAVLFLATSRPEAIWLRHKLERSLHPYRVVVLLDPTRADMSWQTRFQLNHLEWDNVRTLFGDWRRPVHAVMGDAPFIVCDARVDSPAVVEEGARLCRHPELARKTVFVVGAGGVTPALAASGSGLPAGCLGAKPEDEVAAVLTAAGLADTSSPDRYLPPVAGVDHSAGREAALARELRSAAGDAERARLVGELAALGTDAALALLAALLSDANEVVRGAALDALLKAGPRAVPPLVAVLDGPARSKVCYLLGQIADPRALPALRRVMTRPGEHPLVRERAEQAVARIREVHGGPG